MHFRVKFYAYYRKTTGVTEITLEASEGALARQALDLVWQTWPSLAEHRPPAMILLNRSRCMGSEVIQENDLLEIFAPVAGG